MFIRVTKRTFCVKVLSYDKSDRRNSRLCARTRRVTRGQSNLAKAALNMNNVPILYIGQTFPHSLSLSIGASGRPSNTMLWVLESLYPDQDLDPFNCFLFLHNAALCQTDWLTDWRYKVIGRNRPPIYVHVVYVRYYVVHLMWPNNECKLKIAKISVCGWHIVGDAARRCGQLLAVNAPTNQLRVGWGLRTCMGTKLHSNGYYGRQLLSRSCHILVAGVVFMY